MVDVEFHAKRRLGRSGRTVGSDLGVKFRQDLEPLILAEVIVKQSVECVSDGLHQISPSGTSSG
jgi:hypothetical protein